MNHVEIKQFQLEEPKREDGFEITKDRIIITKLKDRFMT